MSLIWRHGSEQGMAMRPKEGTSSVHRIGGGLFRWVPWRYFGPKTILIAKFAVVNNLGLQFRDLDRRQNGNFQSCHVLLFFA